MISTTHFHPMLVHFPIALVVIGFAAEAAALYFKKLPYLSIFGFYLLIIGTLSALAAGLTGALFTSEMSGAAGAIKETHELFAGITLGILAATAILQIFIKSKNPVNSNLKWAAFVLYGLAAVSVSITGFLGGTLVYTYMMPL